MDYSPTTLNLVKGKWYVSVTVPEDLRASFKRQKQLRRSTGTSDKREAQRRQHTITNALYAEFDKARVNPLAEALTKVAQKARLKVPDTMWAALDSWREANFSTHSQEELEEVAELFVAQLTSHYLTSPDDATAELIALIEEGTTRTQPEGQTQNSLSKVFDDYLQSTKFTRYSGRKKAESNLKEAKAFFTSQSISSINTITPVNIYDFAQQLSDEGKAASTIRGRIDSLSLAFKHAVRKGWLDANPCQGLDLTGYGKARTFRSTLSLDELKQLFQLDMPDEHRLLLQLLTMTGARLDEIALLHWDEITTHDLSDGRKATFIDLTKRPETKKNRGSLRHIPIHPSIQLPKKAEGQIRVFPNFKLNKDGKTTTASETLNRYIRQVTEDKNKVVHSLRHGFKDWLRNNSVPKEINDFITGHGSGDASGKYGQGPSLEARFAAITKLKAPWD